MGVAGFFCASDDFTTLGGFESLQAHFKIFLKAFPKLTLFN